MAQKYCTNCGTRVSPGSKFCYECGTKIPINDRSNSQEPEKTQDNLTELIKDSRETGWRQIEAINKIGQIKTIEAVNHLIPLLGWNQINREKDPYNSGRYKKLSYEEEVEAYKIKWAATEALINIGKMAVEPLMDIIEKDFEGITSDMIENNSSGGPGLRGKPVPVISGEHDVKNQSIYILGEIKDDRAIDLLFRCFMYVDAPLDDHYDFSTNFVYSPYRTISLALVTKSLVNISESSPGAKNRVIQGFVYALSNLKEGIYVDRDGVMSDRNSIDDYNARLTNSATAFSHLGTPCIEPLIQLMENQPDLEKEIFSILGTIKEKQVFDLIINRLSVPKGNEDDPDDYTWVSYNQEIFSLLREIISGFGSDGREFLSQALIDSNPKVRLGAARGMGLVGHPSFVNPLTAATSDENSDVAFAALGSLRRTTGTLESLPRVDVWWLNPEILNNSREKPPDDRRGIL